MRTNIENDYELIYSVREIGIEEKDRIFEKYIPVIKAIAYDKYRKLTSHGVDLEDLVQEGFIGLNRAIDNYDCNSSALFYTFACLCIDRQIKNYARTFYRLKEVKDYKYFEETDIYAVVKEPNINYVVSDYYFEQLVHFKNDFSLIRSCVFELRYNGFSYKEIAKLLDIKQKEVDQHLYSLRKYLKEQKVKELFL